MELEKQLKAKMARIIYNSPGYQEKEISDLKQEQLETIRSLYAQKISYETVNGNIETYDDQDQYGERKKRRIPSCTRSMCCCCYPEDNKDFFDITSTTFLKRLFYPVLFWNNNFLAIDNARQQKYGLIWMIASYTIILGLASSLNEYFMEPENFRFENQTMVKALGIILVFKVSEPFIYGGIIGCLGGFIYNNESIMITSYSLVLYFVPTLLCVFPSLYWHLMMVTAGAIFRAVFLYRNYSTKMESKPYLILLVIFIIEALYLVVSLRTMFSGDLGFGFAEPWKEMFGENPVIKSQQGTDQQTVEKTKEHLFQILREFDI